MEIAGRVQFSFGRGLIVYTLVAANTILLVRVIQIVWPHRQMLGSLAEGGWRCFEIGLLGR